MKPLVRSTKAALAIVVLWFSSGSASGAEPDIRVDRGGSRAGDSGDRGFRMPTPAFQTEVPLEAVDVVLAKPSRDGVTLSVRTATEAQVYLEWGLRQGGGEGRLGPLGTLPRIPREIRLAGLRADSEYRYHLRMAGSGTSNSATTLDGRFHTARPEGRPFVFTVQADSHLDYGSELELYRRSLTNAVAAHPDFHLDLGDTFMTDKYARHEDARSHYEAQRHHLGRIASQAALFLVLGNHDGEGPVRARSGDAMAVWANGMRKSHFPNPEPDDFYSGNDRPHPVAGLLQDYYSWHWGDALFVVLDPYWYSTRVRRSEDSGWSRSLGREQYEWLRRILAGRHSRHTFVFLHNLVGGGTSEGRGGAEASAFFEWGGRNVDGSEGFTRNRPGWEAPIHDLLVRRGGVVVFHGHDHFFARQEREGVVYQLLPQPGHRRATLNSATDYGYLEGRMIPGSGILRVRVSRESCDVDFLRVSNNRDTDVPFTYAVRAAQAPK